MLMTINPLSHKMRQVLCVKYWIYVYDVLVSATYMCTYIVYTQHGCCQCLYKDTCTCMLVANIIYIHVYTCTCMYMYM